MKVRWVCRRLNVPDKALTARENMNVPSNEQHRAAGIWPALKHPLNKRGACLRGNAFGYEPVRLIFDRRKLHAVTGVATSDRSCGNTRSGHGAAKLWAEGVHEIRIWRCVWIPVKGALCKIQRSSLSGPKQNRDSGGCGKSDRAPT